MWYSNTQNDFSSGAAIFSLQKLASPRGRNVNYDEKQLTGKKIMSCSFYLYSFRKYVSYGFHIMNFCNPGVHYETPCMSEVSVPFNSNFNSKLYIFFYVLLSTKKKQDLLVAIEDNGL